MFEKTGLDIGALLAFHRSVFGDARMEIPEELRGKGPKELSDIVTYLDGELLRLHQGENGEVRSLTDDEQKRFDDGLSLRTAAHGMLTRHQAISGLAAVPENVERTVNVKTTARTAHEVYEDRTASSRDLADSTVRALEAITGDNERLAHASKVVKAHSRDKEWARSILIRSTDEYSSAFGKIMLGREYDLTQEERTVLGVTTNANGAYLLPTHLDPTIMLTNTGTSNVIRGISRVVTLTEGQPQWNGVTSAGVTASWDGEVVEVSDDTPTIGTVGIPTVRAQALIQVSISAAEDIANLSEDTMMLFADARDRLEGAAHATGVGTTTPKGVFTAVAANSGSKITSGTAAAIALADLDALYTGLSVRYRGSGTWLMNPTYSVAVKALGTAVSASFSGDLTQPTAGRILGHPVLESDDAPNTQTTTTLDNEILFGDFSQYVIVDRPGGMAVEFIPQLFNTANNLPDGRRAWYATWRNGADCTNPAAFRLLQDKTSA